MAKINARLVITVLVVGFALFSLLGSIGVLTAISAGSWGSDRDKTAAVEDLIRVISGAVAAAVLAIGASMLLLRRQALESTESAKAIEKSIANLGALIQPQADAVLKTRESLVRWAVALRGRNSLYMSGMSLRTNSIEYRNSIEEILKSGGECRFLLLKPDTKSSDVVARNFLGQTNPRGYNADIRRSLDRLSDLQVRYPAQVEIRVLDHVPAVSISYLDADLSSGKIFVEFYTYEDSSVKRPHLELSADTSPMWYNYFAAQFSKTWAQGDAWRK